MGNFEREQLLLKEIKKWQVENLYIEESMNNLHYDEWIVKLMGKLSPDLREQYIQKVDSILFHFSTYIQNSEFLKEARKKIIVNAKVFNEQISDLHALKECSIDQLIYLSNQQVAKQRLLSLVQGGISGAGNRLVIGSDVPVSILLQLYSVQRIAMSYGYNVFEPYELVLTLKVFQMATLPKQFRYQYWEELETEIAGKDMLQSHFFEAEEHFIDSNWDQFLIKQLSKIVILYYFKKKFGKKLPIVGVVFGALSNYNLTREITETANYFYQKRWIMERLS